MSDYKDHLNLSEKLESHDWKVVSTLCWQCKKCGFKASSYHNTVKPTVFANLSLEEILSCDEMIIKDIIE